jgi:hypothetical protein
VYMRMSAADGLSSDNDRKPCYLGSLGNEQKGGGGSVCEALDV